MEKAVLQAVYYTDIPIITSNKIILHYTVEKDFKTILDQAYKNVEIRKLLGNTSNISYQILEAISKMFKKLLVSMLNSLCVITREGTIISILGSNNTKNNKIIGIIKIDAVLAELNINLYMNQTTLFTKMTKVIGVFGLFGMVGWIGYNYQNNLNVFSFSKND